MRFFYLIPILSLSIVAMANAQQGGLINILGEIKQNLKTIESKNSTLKQNITFKEGLPYIVTFVMEVTDNKGVETTEYQLNLAYLNERQVKWESSRKQMSVGIYSTDKFIQVTQNGERENYEDELVIPCPDIDNARLIEELIKKAIPMARERWEKDSRLPDDFAGLKNYVTDEVKDVEEGSETYVQKLEGLDDKAARFVFSKKHITEKGEEIDRSYAFNFADIHPPSIATSVKGKSVYVELKTADRNKYIEVTEGKEVSYTDGIEIHTSSYEDAQVLTIALRRFVPEAREHYRDVLPSFSSNTEALAYLNNAIKSYNFNQTKITQTGSGQCVFELTREVSDDKSTNAERFIADLSDLASNSIEIDVSSKGIWVVAETREKANYVMAFENGEKQNYDSDLSIGAADIPNAKAIRHGLSEAINTCKRDISPKDFSWMAKLINENNDPRSDIEQKLESVEGNKCKAAVTVIESGKRETTEDRYEFNLFDLDEKTVILDTKRTDAFVQFTTNYQERIINHYKDDGDIDYVNELAVTVPDISTGKVFLETLKSLIEKCKK